MKKIIGQNTYVDILEYQNIPAKIDTGADSSAIWASDINVTQDGILSFKLFAKDSPFFDNKIIKTSDYKVVITRSSHGDQKIYYRANLPAIIKGQKINVLFTLSNRASHHFPVLIGRRTISGRFIVDVSKYDIASRKKAKTSKLNQELKKNPYKFHQKYIKNNEE